MDGFCELCREVAACKWTRLPGNEFQSNVPPFFLCVVLVGLSGNYPQNLDYWSDCQVCHEQ